MKGIGGNTKLTFQVKTTQPNAIGEQEVTWTDVQTITGWLDLSSGGSNYTTYSAKVAESTDVFIADYEPLDSRISVENASAIVNGERFDVMWIDDPMGMHQQLEIYLKSTGGH